MRATCICAEMRLASVLDAGPAALERVAKQVAASASAAAAAAGAVKAFAELEKALELQRCSACPLTAPVACEYAPPPAPEAAPPAFGAPPLAAPPAAPDGKFEHPHRS